MSYILEALKKAEAERRSGNAPSIHAPHSFAPPRTARAWWQHPATWAAVAVLLLAAAAGGWLLIRSPAAPAVPPQLAAAPAVRPAPEPAPAAAPAEPPVSAARQAPEASPPPAPASRREPAPEAKPRPEPKPRPKPAPAKQEQKAPPPSAAQAPEQTPAPPLRELPEQIQREIPSLQIGGYIYSASPADRSVLINKRLVREGDEVAPGLTLEKMTPSGMVLNYRGHRYRSSY